MKTPKLSRRAQQLAAVVRVRQYIARSHKRDVTGIFFKRKWS